MELCSFAGSRTKGMIGARPGMDLDVLDLDRWLVKRRKIKQEWTKILTHLSCCGEACELSQWKFPGLNL